MRCPFTPRRFNLFDGAVESGVESAIRYADSPGMLVGLNQLLLVLMEKYWPAAVRTKPSGYGCLDRRRVMHSQRAF